MNNFLDDETFNIVINFKKRIEEILGVKVKEILIFGSRARGDYKLDSDLDIIIVSNDWKGCILDRMAQLYKIWNYNIDATLIPLKPKELKEKIKKSITIRDASKYWIRIT